MLKVDNVVPVVTLAELKAHLRIEDEREDAILAAWVRAATEVIERELGQLLIARSVVEEVAAGGAGVRLTARPVVRIETVAQSGDGDDWQELAVGAYAAAVAADGSVSLSVTGTAAGRLRVQYRAGMATEANELPEFIRQAVVRTAAHWYAYRDSAEALALPQAVRQMLATVNSPRLRAIGARP